MTHPKARDLFACAVLERTADGVAVGRCYHYVRDGQCERHGDVSEVQRRYRLLGVLQEDPRDRLRRSAEGRK